MNSAVVTIIIEADFGFIFAGIFVADMTYQQTLDYLYTRLPMFSKVGSAAIKPGFDNILQLCEFLGNPQERLKFIHIAGTNGKGSVSHMMASILQSQGYKTGLYTSPHLTDFRERVKVDGMMIDEKEVTGFVEKIKPEIEQLTPSFFEITVALALHHFANTGVDYAVMETGLGGRLDSTNIILPEISIITNIGFDHMQLLGDTLEKIAAEKAGIIKQNVPVVIGETNAETAPVFIAKAKEQNASMSFADQEYHVENWFYENDLLVVEVSQNNKADHFKYQLDLPGAYQAKNLLTVLEACHQLNKQGVLIELPALKNGLAHAKKQTGLHGRWETITRNPRIVLDVAHNVDGMQQVLNQLELTAFRKLHIILGMVKDKDVDAVLALLPKSAHYYFTNADIPRALPANELQQKAVGFELEGTVWNNVNTALDEVKLHAHSDDLILVCGSVFLVGEVRRF